MDFSSRLYCAAVLLSFAALGLLRADVALPGNVLAPKTIPEAWNVIRLATTNVQRLMSEKRLQEIPMQVSLCSPALRALAALEATPERAAQVSRKTERALGWVVAISRTSSERNRAATEDGFKTLKSLLDELSKDYDPATVQAEIFFCILHPEYVATKGDNLCGRCGTVLLKRRIPYSFIYTSPEAPSLLMTGSASIPIEAGKSVDVKVRFHHRDKMPVLPSELIETHGQKVHLLIEEPGLGDYHHEHPLETKTPGEYSFSFTPKKTAPYRIWADLVPANTGMQELPYIDLNSSGRSDSIEDKASTFTATSDGFVFTLSLSEGNHRPIASGQIRKIAIAVADPAGMPVRSLEPVMNSFAHLVGFYEDYKTVLHLQPAGGEILDPKARGGPAMAFQFFPPKPGFVRLYCQVRINEKPVFASFNVNVTKGPQPGP